MLANPFYTRGDSSAAKYFRLLAEVINQRIKIN
jgi:hypothetical protein